MKLYRKTYKHQAGVAEEAIVLAENEKAAERLLEEELGGYQCNRPGQIAEVDVMEPKVLLIRKGE